MASLSLLNAPSVMFMDVLDHYCCNKSITFTLKFDVDYTVCDTDEVAILKLGWSNKNEALAKKPIGKVSNERICCVTFKCDELPKEYINLYQICYFHGQELQGASSAFDLWYSESSLSESFISKVLPSFESANIYQSVQEKDNEISRLKEENASLQEENELLKKSLKVLLNDKLEKQEKGCDKQIAELKDLFNSLQSTVHANDKDIKMLKRKIVEGGEEYKKLYLEKHKLEKKYERVLNAFQQQRESQVNSSSGDDEINFDLNSLPSLPSISSILSK